MNYTNVFSLILVVFIIFSSIISYQINITKYSDDRVEIDYSNTFSHTHTKFLASHEILNYLDDFIEKLQLFNKGI